MIYKKTLLKNREEFEEEFQIDQFIVHENYNASIHWNNDIALLRLKPKSNRGIRFGPHVQPLCLPPTKVPYTPDTDCTVCGWGTFSRYLPKTGAITNQFFYCVVKNK